MLEIMKRCMIWLVVASLCRSFVWAFSVHDDIYAFPQYEIVFSEKYIREEDAKSKLSFAATPPIDSPRGINGEASGSDISTGGTTDKTSMHDAESSEGVSQTYERMILKNLTYLCAIPQPRQPRNETKEELSPEEEENELARATDRGWELLKGMKGNCMYYQSGWWSYSFCYETEIKQFHPLAPQRGGQPAYPPVEDTNVPSFVLGEFDSNQRAPKQVDGKGKPASGEATTNPSALAIRKKGDTRYLVQQLGGGSTCDLTGKPRRVEVQFHCHPQSTDRIGWIKEIATCAYLMVIYTPRLCNDVAFLPPKEHKAAPIVCSEVVADEAQLAAWQARQAARMEQLLLGSAGIPAPDDTPAAPTRPMVGGIELGGMRITGPDGGRITPPQMVEQIPNQGNVIARWRPDAQGGVLEMLADDELLNLDLDPDMVDQMKNEIHHEANGRPWKLELVQIGGVRELIGVVEKGEGGDEQGRSGFGGDGPRDEDYPDPKDEERQERKGEARKGAEQKGEPRKGEERKGETHKEDEGKGEDRKGGRQGSKEQFKDEL